MTRLASRASKGSVLLVVLVVIALLTLASYTFCDRMLQHRRGAALHGRRLQAVALCASGRELVALLLDQDRESLQRAGGIYDNPDRLRGVLVLDGDVATTRGRFSVIAPGLEDDRVGSLRFGLENESARININTLLAAEKRQTGDGRNLLLALPGMTDEIADAVLDWIDTDDQPRRFGAEADYYAGLNPPYAPRNGPLLSVEELLLVRGVSAQLLYGADLNRNGLLDEQEAESPVLAAMESFDNTMVRGWAGYLTLYSVEKNARPDGTPKIDLNQDDLQNLHNELTATFDAETATFIVTYRQYGSSQSGQPGEASQQPGGGRRSRGQRSDAAGGPTGGTSSTQPGKPSAAAQGSVQPQSATQGTAAGDLSKSPAKATDASVSARQPSTAQAHSSQSGKIDFTKAGSNKLQTVLDLIGARVQVPAPNQNQPPTVLESPFSERPSDLAETLPQLLANTTIDAAETIRGRININQASRAVLSGLPGVTEETVGHILAVRDVDVPPQRPGRLHATWILAEGIVDLSAMKRLLPLVTGGGSAHRAQVVGYYEQGGPVARTEAILSATTSPPQLLFWRDISHLGHGFAPETLGVE